MPRHLEQVTPPLRVKESEREKLARPRQHIGLEVLWPSTLAFVFLLIAGAGVQFKLDALSIAGFGSLAVMIALFLIYQRNQSAVLAERWREEEKPAPEMPEMPPGSLIVQTPRRTVEVARYGPRRIVAGDWAWDFTNRDVTLICGWIERGDLGVRREQSGNGRGFEDFGMGGGDYSIFLAALRKAELITEHGRLTDWNERGVAFWTGSPTPDGERLPTVVQVHDDNDG